MEKINEQIKLFQIVKQDFSATLCKVLTRGFGYLVEQDEEEYVLANK